MGSQGNVARPDIFSYHNHISFLKDWFVYLKKTKDDFSMRTIAKNAGIATGYLPMVLSGRRTLTEKSFQKLINHLYLSQQERKFLSLLRLVGESHEPAVRISAVEQMGRLERFKKNNSKEVEVYKYLTKWFYVAIREMVLLRDFEMKAEWIQQKLQGRLSIAEIDDAVEFLKAHNYISQDDNGKWVHAKAILDCKEGIFKLSLGEFHRQMFELASQSIEKTPRPQRYILGHTVALSPQDFKKICDVLDNALKEVRETGVSASEREHVYHIEMAAFPLTRGVGQ